MSLNNPDCPEIANIPFNMTSFLGTNIQFL
jgi:hypothetical protein